ncbi:hypothetical protein BJX63DRAFT_444099 [Aspergillus granulosus]|uniref:Uncharacterized protein n=1 Tax=Aspergillus granulosus TaxID=176169 RepID=A0ABR4H7I1_9EURO
MSESIPLGPIPRASQDTNASTGRDRDDDRPASPNVESPPDYEPPKEQTELLLHPRSIYALLLALFYAALVLAPWVIICLIADRPITTDRYGAFTGGNGTYFYRAEDTQSPYRKNERWYHAARIIQAIAGVLTLPLTSAICASAAVIFMQRQQSLTMPQLMTLADNGWMDLSTYRRIYLLQWSRYGSSFLLFSILVSLLGLVIAPIQSIFLSSQAVKTPTQVQEIGPLWDLPTQVQRTAEASVPDDNLITLLTRTALTTATTDETHAQLWPGANVSCDPFSYAEYPYSHNLCLRQGGTFNNISSYPDPFLAQLPSSFHTGLLRQFLPRINSTAQFQPIGEAEFPENCDQIPNAFFVEYTNSTRYYDTELMQTWSLKACMPANVTESPWKATRDRHDFSEELYIDVTLENYNLGYNHRALYRITLNTTTGYFELPNYMNGGVAGFLLDQDPNELCDDRCEYQEGYAWLKRRSEKRETHITPVPGDLQVVRSKGPLLTIAMALFGDGSYIETRAKHPERYGPLVTRNYSSFDQPSHISACRDFVPLGHLLPDARISENHCIRNSDGADTGIHYQVAYWLMNFLEPIDQLENAFNAAAFIATKKWLEHPMMATFSGDRRVNFDMGADTQVPVISLAGITVVSALLGLHVLALLLLGLYSAWSPRWTKRLDSFAMMRIGGAISQHVPLLMAHRLNMVKGLRAVPGWIGDQMPESEPVGMLGLGGPLRLRSGRKYISYHRKPRYTT